MIIRARQDNIRTRDQPRRTTDREPSVSDPEHANYGCPVCDGRLQAVGYHEFVCARCGEPVIEDRQRQREYDREHRREIERERGREVIRR